MRKILIAAAVAALAGFAGPSMAVTYIYPDGSVVRTPKSERLVQTSDGLRDLHRAKHRRAHHPKAVHHHRHGYKAYWRGGRHYYGYEHDQFLDRRI